QGKKCLRTPIPSRYFSCYSYRLGLSDHWYRTGIPCLALSFCSIPCVAHILRWLLCCVYHLRWYYRVSGLGASCGCCLNCCYVWLRAFVVPWEYTGRLRHRRYTTCSFSSSSYPCNDYCRTKRGPSLLNLLRKETHRLMPQRIEKTYSPPHYIRSDPCSIARWG